MPEADDTQTLLEFLETGGESTPHPKEIDTSIISGDSQVTRYATYHLKCVSLELDGCADAISRYYEALGCQYEEDWPHQKGGTTWSLYFRHPEGFRVAVSFSTTVTGGQVRFSVELHRLRSAQS